MATTELAMEKQQLVDELQQQLEGLVMQQSNNSMNDFSWNLDDLLEATLGERVGPVADDNEKLEFNSVSTDSRTIKAGALYVAIKGERFDGHDYIEQAVKQGAVAVLVSEICETVVPGVLVDDTRIALGEFGRWHRQQMPVKKLIAVTGSNGKTTVKTMLHEIFSGVAETLATEGNLNNDFGVPRTLLNLRPEHEYAIIEMGANHLKEIGYLTSLALPDIAIVNNASGAHLEGFGSLQGVIDTKGEIYQGLNQIAGREPGVAIVNTDSNGFDDWMPRIDSMGVQQKILFGSKAQADVQLISVSNSDAESGLAVTLEYQSQQHKLNLKVLGEHNAMNAAACAAISLAAGLSWQQIIAGLERFNGVAGRLQKQKIKTGWLLDDSYNANPESLKAGIQAVTSMHGASILCIGAMAEVGETSDEAHQEVAEFASQKQADYLFVYGEAAKNMPQFFTGKAQWYDSHASMAEDVNAILQQAQNSKTNMNVLVKGSRSAAMEKVAEAILQKMQ